jgi:hypothetical protein
MERATTREKREADRRGLRRASGERKRDLLPVAFPNGERGWNSP